MKWFYAHEGQPLGPVDDSELAHLAATGRIDGATLVWHNALTEWRPYAEFAPPPAKGPPPLPPVIASPRSLPVVAAEPALPYAGFWVRVAAAIFDGLILIPVYVVLGIGFFVGFPDFLSTDDAQGGGWRTLFQVALVLVAAVYETIFVGAWGATPGKMICDLRVVRPDGARVTYLRAFGRAWGKRLSSVCLWIGYLIVAFDSQKRGLHDYICSTRVIHSQPSAD